MSRKLENLRMTDAQRALVEQWLRLAYRVVDNWCRARRPSSCNADRDDMRSLALYQLCRAAMCWNPNMAAFSTYATLSIRRALGRWWQYERSVVRFPSYATLRSSRSLDAMMVRGEPVGEDARKVTESALSVVDSPSPEDEGQPHLKRLVARMLLSVEDHVTGRCLEARYLQGMSLVDVGKLVGLSKTGVANHLERGLALLRGRFPEAVDEIA